MDPKQFDGLKAAIVIVGMGAFIALYGWFAWETMDAPNGRAPDLNPVATRVAIGIAATMSGLFTVALGISKRNNRPLHALGTSAVGGGMLPNITAGKALRFVIGLGPWIYFFLGLVVVIIWGANSKETPDELIDLATLWIGFVVAAFGTIVGVPQDS